MVRYGSHVVTDGEAFVEAARQQELEGVVAKLRRSPYEPGRRSKSWLKIKLRREQEVVVAGWLEGQGSHRDLGSLIVAVHEEDRLRHAGQVGRGSTPRRGASSAPASTSWPATMLAARPRPAAAWRALGRAADRDPRRVRGVDDRRPAPAGGVQGLRDREGGVGGAARAAGRHGPRGERGAAGGSGCGSASRVRAGRRVPPPASAAAAPAATNDLDRRSRRSTRSPRRGCGSSPGASCGSRTSTRCSFPPLGTEPPLTKRDLLRYHASVAPVLVPYLARPRVDGAALSERRRREGVLAEGPARPRAAVGRTRWTYHRPRGGAEGLRRGRRAATLAWLAQEGAVELHPWTSRTDAPDKPDLRADRHRPGRVDDVRGGARPRPSVPDRARAPRASAPPKVTGKRGVQIWIPIEPRYIFEETRDWVEGSRARWGRRCRTW